MTYLTDATAGKNVAEMIYIMFNETLSPTCYLLSSRWGYQVHVTCIVWLWYVPSSWRMMLMWCSELYACMWWHLGAISVIFWSLYECESAYRYISVTLNVCWSACVMSVLGCDLFHRWRIVALVSRGVIIMSDVVTLVSHTVVTLMSRGATLKLRLKTYLYSAVKSGDSEALVKLSNVKLNVAWCQYNDRMLY